MSTSQRRSTKGSGRVALDQAEAAIVDQYTRLVRLAYLTLPHSLSRHRRVLAAHALVERALPGFRGGHTLRRVPEQRGSTPGPGAAWARARVLRSALAYDRRPRRWPSRLPPPRVLCPMLPMVWGLRLFPRAGGAEETAVGQLLSRTSAPVRAAFVLCRLDGLSAAEAQDALKAAGAPHPRQVVSAARRLEETTGPATALVHSSEFDACFLQARPTDLLRRRRRFRLAWCAMALGAVCAVLSATVHVATEPHSSRTIPSHPALGADQLLRTPRGLWADTARVDFSAWPPRGARADDRALLTRALAVWTKPPHGTRITQGRSTTTEPPDENTRLLYAGVVGREAVVLFHDGRRVVRYGEPASMSEAATLDFGRADDSDVTTAAALAVSRAGDTVRYLTAPWITEARTRDLLDPDSPGRPLKMSDGGITAALQEPSDHGSCDELPVLQLRSSTKIVEKHTFLVTDLGDLTPAHLTYQPLPGAGAPARQPREATSGAALLSWARTACRLPELRRSGVRAVDQWDFAEQDLPEDSGRAVWSCLRASTWQGPGSVRVQFRTSKPSATGQARTVARAGPTAACSRFGQHVVAGTRWTADSGHGYVLAAGSRRVRAITVSGDVDTTKHGTTLAVRSPKDARTKVRARLEGGESLRALGS